MLWLLLACSREPTIRQPPASTAETGTPVGPATGATGDTAVPPEPVPVTCVADELNALRATCDLGEGATVGFEAPGAPTRSFTGAGPTPIWGLLPERDYTWTSGPWSGVVRTGALPEPLARLQRPVEGTLPAGVEAVLFTGGCGGSYFVMVDGAGEVLWYEPQSVVNQLGHGFEWTDDDTVIAINGSTYVEVGVDGSFVRSLGAAVLTGALHHDLARWGEYTYVLYEEPVGGIGVDGVHVLFGDTLVASVRLDAFWPVSSGAFGDWVHANGIEVDDDGQLSISLLNHDTVVGMDGRPGSPSFLTPTWVAAGQGTSFTPETYRPVSLPADGFDGQHNAKRVGDTLWVFDNTGVGAGSRAARFQLASSGEMTLDAAWSLGKPCPVQGGAMPLPGGGVLATCPLTHELFAFAEGLTAPVWHLPLACDLGAMPPLPRGVPVESVP